MSLFQADSVQKHPLIRPEAIIGSRTMLQSNVPKQQVVVHWHQLPREESSWESFEEMKKSFPSMHLEDNVIFDGESNDKIIDFPVIFLNNENAKGSVQAGNEENVEVQEAGEAGNAHSFKGRRKKQVPHWPDNFVHSVRST